MPSTTTFYSEDWDQYYDVTHADGFTVLRTHEYGYTYVLSYDRRRRKYTIVHTNNPALVTQQ